MKSVRMCFTRGLHDSRWQRSGRVVRMSACTPTSFARRSSTLTSATEADAANSRQKLILGLLGGTAAFCAYQVYSVATDWPEACELMMLTARNNVELIERFGGAVAERRLLWDGRVKPGFVQVKIPVKGANGVRGDLFGSAILTDDKWRLLNAEVQIYSASAEGSEIGQLLTALTGAVAGGSPPSPAAQQPTAGLSPTERVFGPGVEAVYDLLGAPAIEVKDRGVHSGVPSATAPVPRAARLPGLIDVTQPGAVDTIESLVGDRRRHTD